MKVMGQNTLNIDVSSTVRWGNSRLRVALVLDVTGSMASDGKISALRTATKNLLSQLQGAAAQNGDVLVSIIPFAKTVNVNQATTTQAGSTGPPGIRRTEGQAAEFQAAFATTGRYTW